MSMFLALCDIKVLAWLANSKHNNEGLYLIQVMRV